VEFRDLEAFVAVAQEQGIRAAAAILKADPGTVSRAITRLERSVGSPLLVRGATGVVLTDAGQLFLGEARASLVHAGRAVMLARHASVAASANGERPVVVGLPPFPAVPEVSQVLAHVRRSLGDRPYVLRRLSWRDDFSGDRVRAGTVDLAISVLPGSAANLVGVAVRSVPRVVALPLTHALGKPRSVAPHQLDGMKAVAPLALSGEALRFWSLDPQTNGKRRRLAPRPNSVSDLLGQIAEGQGFLTVPAFIPLMWQRSDIALQRLKASPCSIGIVWNPDHLDESLSERLVSGQSPVPLAERCVPRRRAQA